MMIKLLILAIVIVKLIFEYYEMSLIDKQRLKPLPEEVADVYSPERYQTFLDYKADQRRVHLAMDAVNIIMTLIILFSPLLKWIESLGGHNVYSFFFYTIFILTVIAQLTRSAFNYYSTFTIEEKYGKNKKTKAIFFKDEALEFILELVLYVILFIPVMYICEHLDGWTNHFQMSYTQSFLITLGIFAIIGVIVLLIMGISYMTLHLQYHFTDLEEGPLRDKINALMTESKKKVKLIKVYDESKKSTSKNAFLLKMLWHREFGIADNFLTENAEDELLAVLSHEVGHLKHKKNIYNYLKYSVTLLFFGLLVYLIPHGQMVVDFNHYVMRSFSLTTTSYYMMFYVISELIGPFMLITSLYHNFVSRREEYEADQNAAKEGYGEALITTFKQLSSDELIDVNPPQLIETLEYDHPSMYHRIVAIRKGEALL